MYMFCGLKVKAVVNWQKTIDKVVLEWFSMPLCLDVYGVGLHLMGIYVENWNIFFNLE